MENFPDTGKVHQDFFKEIIFPACGAQREEVLTGPEFGVDVSVVKLPGGYALASTSDPLSLIPSLGLQESAWLSVHLMASDMATTGHLPQYALFTLNLPPTLRAEDFSTYWHHISDFCKELGTAIVGGHTGRFEGQNSTVAGGGTMLTVAPENTVLTSKGARPGDELIMTRECAISASAILALSFPETIRNACGAETLQQAQQLFYATSAVHAAVTAVKAGIKEKGVTAMHDVTEGGVCGAMYELASASDCGVAVFAEQIPAGNAQQQICAHFGIDPLFSVGAGSLIIAAAPGKAEQIIEALKQENIPARVVGKLTEKEKGMTLWKEGKSETLIHPGEDPYWKAFFQAFQAGWK